MTDTIDCVLPVKHTHASLKLSTYTTQTYTQHNVVFTYKVLTQTILMMTCVLVVTMTLARGGLSCGQ